MIVFHKLGFFYTHSLKRHNHFPQSVPASALAHAQTMDTWNLKTILHCKYNEILTWLNTKLQLSTSLDWKKRYKSSIANVSYSWFAGCEKNVISHMFLLFVAVWTTDQQTLSKIVAQGCWPRYFDVFFSTWAIAPTFIKFHTWNYIMCGNALLQCHGWQEILSIPHLDNALFHIIKYSFYSYMYPGK